MGIKRLVTSDIDNFFLWGLLTASGGHRVCWELNRSLGIDLSRQEDIVLTRRPSAEDAYFNFYSFEDPVSFIRIELIRNKCNGEFYSRELKNFDYLLMVKGELDLFEADPFTSILRQVSSIQSALEIEVNKIKNQEILILE